MYIINQSIIIFLFKQYTILKYNINILNNITIENKYI